MFAAACCFTAPAWTCETPAGRLVSAEAVVEVRPAGKAGWVRVQPPQSLCEGDQVAIRSPGRAAIVLKGDILVRLDQQTTLQLTRVAPGADADLSLDAGLIHVITRFRKRFGVTTPFVNAVVDGTEFTISAAAGASRIVVAEGRVHARNAQAQRELAAGDGIESAAGSTPVPIVVQPLDAVRWAIHYPQIVWLDHAEVAALPPAAGATVAGALQAMAGARHAEALATLDGLSHGAAGPRVEALRASLLLALGRVDQARAQIDRMARDADAFALEAVIGVARNERDGALAAARRAVAVDAASAAAQLALSYALQARGEVTPARDAATEATRLAPTHPFAWARRAELELSLAQIEHGKASAAEALAHAPALARARTLLGFAHLLGGDTDRAADSFGAAIAADSGDPLARFGSGLAHVRRGEIPAARRDIEIAVLLDPSNAELRSYLGRVYVEEDRAALAGEQFALARRLDPASPTPWHLDAFRKLRDNDPLGAIADAGKAIELNDNRAAFRSSELLDSDRAARSASLGEAYRDLGFDQPMLAAAVRAVADDAMSPASHRLLADAHAAVPRHETARLGELFQARVRQPIGQFPVPAQFLSRTLPIVDGPRALTPEESTALFERKPSHFAAALLGGSNHTRGASLVAARAWERAEVSLGHFDYRRDGFRDRADIDLSGTQLGLRLAPASGITIHGELGHGDYDGGEFIPALLDGVGLASQRLRQSTNTDRGRLSMRYAPSIEREFIATAGGQRTRERTVERVVLDDVLDVDLNTRMHARDAGVLYAQHGTDFTLVAGGSTYRESGTTTTELRIASDVFPDPDDRYTKEHHRAFGHLDLTPTRWLTLHLGAAFDSLHATKAASGDRSEGKGGMSLKLAPATTVRIAQIRGTKGPKYLDATLEPTQFAGFNQLFDDLDGTRWRRTAVGLDHRFESGVMAGVEWSRRALEVPDLGCSSPCRADWSERLHRAYLALPLGRNAALSLSWRYEGLRLNEPPTTLDKQPFQTRTEILPIGLWAKLAPRLTTYVEAVRVRQDTTIVDALAGGPPLTRAGNFWLANAHLSYTHHARRFGFSIALHNVFDRRFSFQDTDLNRDPRVPLFYPKRTLLLQTNLRL